MRYPNCGPNRLIQTVSATEGFARTVAIYLRSKTINGLLRAYKKFRYLNPEKLIKDIICTKLKTTPGKLFSCKAWNNFLLAVEYRNLLIHESTFLRRSISEILISDTKKVFDKLQEINIK